MFFPFCWWADQFLGVEKDEQVFRGKLRVTGIDHSITSLRTPGARRDFLSERFGRPSSDPSVRNSSGIVSSNSRIYSSQGLSRTSNSLQGTGVRRRTFEEDNSHMETPWRAELEDTTSDEYAATVKAFQQRMDLIYSNSLFKKAFIRSEILALDRYSA